MATNKVTDNRIPSALTLPKVEKGVRKGEEWVSKVEPGVFNLTA